MKKLLNFIVLFLFLSNLYGQIQPYYNGLDFTKSGNELYDELSAKIISTHIGIPYTAASTDTWDVLIQGDEDPESNLNVLLIYGYNDNDGIFKTDRSRLKTETDRGGGDLGKWNREHVFAKSLARPILSTDEPGPGTDVHNLKPADSEFNADRSNRKFTDGSGNAGIVSANGGWYPGDEWKGDIARIVMYMYLRYNGDGSRISETRCLPVDIGFGTALDLDQNMIDLFLRWNAEDPVSDFEDQRNTVIEGSQGNRNPFIDNPYLATLIWGGLNAEDRWDLNNSMDSQAPSIPTNVMASDITDDAVEISWEASTDNVGVVDYLIYLDGAYLQTSSLTSTKIIGLSDNTGYDIAIRARDASANLSDFSNVINIKTLVGPIILLAEDFDDCTDLNFFEYDEASNKSWACERQYGENKSGSMGINGYQQDVYSKDWLITKNAIDFSSGTGEKLSFYADAAYGSTPLELVYSSDYDGLSNPSNFTWTPVPNVSIPIHSDGSGNEEVFIFSDVDISAITGSVYMAFKYYANSSPTRWTVDSFEISAVDSALALGDFEVENVILKGYPNPNRGVLNIAIPKSPNQVMIALYTMQSKLISKNTYKVSNGDVQMDIEDLPTGLYMVQVNFGNHLGRFKIMKF